MSECRSLIRLLFDRHRTAITVWMGLIAVWWVLALGLDFASRWWSDSRSEIAGSTFTDVLIPIAGATTLFAGLWGVILMDFYRASEVSGETSAYEAWLLRTPIPSWKLAVVPILAKTAWLFTIGLLLIAAMIYGSDSREISAHWLAAILVWFLGSLAASSIAVSFSAVLWRASSRHWVRGVHLVAIFLLAYVILFVFSVTQSVRIDWHWRWLSGLAIVVCYLVVVGYGIRVVELARVHSLGLIPADEHHVDRVGSAVTKVAEPPLAGCSPALRWHDRTRSIRNLRLSGVMAWFWLPGIILLSALMPAGPVYLCVLVWVSWTLSETIACMVAESAVWGQRSSLPDYLIAAPIDASRFAWNRLYACVRTAGLACTVLLGLAAGTMMLRGELHQVAEGWGLIDGGWAKPGWAGASVTRLSLRMGLAVGLATVAMTMTQAVAFQWLQASGRNWFGVLVWAILILSGCLAVGVGVTWFNRHPDLDTLKADLANLQSWAGVCITSMLAVKLVVASMASAFVLRRGDLSARALLVIGACWVVWTFGTAGALSAISPHRWWTLASCSIAMAVMTPLSLVISLPSMVRWNLHR